jgi:recombination protein RecA
MTEDERRRRIRQKLAALPEKPRSLIPTGFDALDRALGGGLPCGAIVELFGPAGCGKTALALRFAASIQQQGLTAAWIDAEHAFNPVRAAELGVAIETMPLLSPDSAEQALEIARTLSASHAVDLLVVDSAAALVPELELQSAIGEAGPGLQTRVLASGLRRLAATVARSAACILFLNQTRTRRDSSGEDSETTAGGAPLKLYAALRIALSPVTIGRVRLRLLKNKAAGALGTVEIPLPRDPNTTETL